MHRFRTVLVILTAALPAALVPRRADAQVAAVERARLEPRGFDFTPDGVWRRRARQVRQAREAALARGDLASLNAPVRAASLRAPGSAPGSSMMVSGILRSPVFLVRYRNTDTTQLRPSALYFDVLGAAAPTGGRPYTMRTFYEEMSNGLLSVQTQVVGWLALDSNDTWYEGTQNGLTASGKVAQLIAEAVSRSDASLDFGQFDNDGPDGIPNSGDDDGFVDVAIFVHPERGGECGSNQNIWAHRYFYAGWTGAALATNDDRIGPGGTVQGKIRVNNYTIQSGVGGATACDATQIMPPGTVAHEMGHGLGLPDLYDTDPNDSDYSEGIGHWGLMSSGNYRRPLSPAYMEGHSRLQLGWVTVRDITVNGAYTLGPYTVGDTIVRLVPTGANPRNEYYLLENRQGTGSDSALITAYAPGLLIWHVDPVQYASGLGSNTVNSGPIHGLALEQADGLDNLGSSTPGVVNRGDAGDPYPGATGNRRFSFSTNPAARLNSGGFAGFIVDSITQTVPGGEMRFRVLFGSLTSVRASDTTALVRVRGVPYAVFGDVFNDGDTVTISMDSAQTDVAGRTQFVFESWSTGLPRTHVATVGLAGQTITATVSRRFEYIYNVIGNGGVVASPAITAGAFVPQGDSVTYTASPAAGSAFIGWSGDTVTNAPTLRLRATRPWSVTATFQAALAVQDSALRSPVMGAAYQDTVRLTGATGVYTFSLLTGSLPPGIVLTPGGVFTGTPTKDSTYTFTVRAISGVQQLDLPLRLAVTAPLVTVANVVAQLLGSGTPLSPAEVRYLDLLGNNSGTLDVGDVLAWFDKTGAVVSAEVMQRILARGAR